MSKAMTIAAGCIYYPGYLKKSAQQELVGHIRSALESAPLFQPVMPGTGKPFSVRMSNMGKLGWVSDREKGYRYQCTHPVTGKEWPPLPAALTDLWDELTGFPLPPQACLINYYDKKARMGLHRDADEEHLQAPILSVSLGDRAQFRIGGRKRSDPTRAFALNSGDVLILCPPLRDALHGIDRIFYGSSRLLTEGGRFNLTLRRVTL